MKVLDIIVLIAAVILLVFGSYVFLTLKFPSEILEYKVSNPSSNGMFSTSLSSNFMFYPNMRYQNSEISYRIESACGENKRKSVQEAFSILSERTILSFKEAENGEIDILCSQIAPEVGQEDHFIAGEGGPAEIVNVTRYNIILKGKISLYRDEKCDDPYIALHEILHSLGFDHNNNENSIMYSITSCNQELDSYIIEEIRRLYSILSLPDVVMEKVEANKTGRYLSFKAVVANYGLKDAKNAKLSVLVGGEVVDEFDLEDIQLGTKKSIEVTNLRVPRNSSNIIFSALISDGNELSYENNKLELVLTE